MKNICIDIVCYVILQNVIAIVETEKKYYHLQESRFIEVATVFINHCIEFIKQHRHFIGQDEKYFIQLQSIVR